jgi:hypothetical protein
MGLNTGDLCIGLYRHRSHDEIDGGTDGPLLPASVRRVDMSDMVIIPGFIQPSNGQQADAFKTNGEPVLAMPGSEALHVGASTASFYLVREDLLNNLIDLIKTWDTTHTHAVAEGVATASPLPYPPLPDVASQRIKVDQ